MLWHLREWPALGLIIKEQRGGCWANSPRITMMADDLIQAHFVENSTTSKVLSSKVLAMLKANRPQ